MQSRFPHNDLVFRTLVDSSNLIITSVFAFKKKIKNHHQIIIIEERKMTVSTSTAKKTTTVKSSTSSSSPSSSLIPSILKPALRQKSKSIYNTASLRKLNILQLFIVAFRVIIIDFLFFGHDYPTWCMFAGAVCKGLEMMTSLKDHQNIARYLISSVGSIFISIGCCLLLYSTIPKLIEEEKKRRKEQQQGRKKL